MPGRLGHERDLVPVRRRELSSRVYRMACRRGEAAEVIDLANAGQRMNLLVVRYHLRSLAEPAADALEIPMRNRQVRRVLAVGRRVNDLSRLVESEAPHVIARRTEELQG